MASTPPDYASAAKRHYHCATLLNGQQQLGNADHLAGFAAECSLKAILLEHLGASLNARNRPEHPKGPNTEYGHADKLWGQVASTAHGRTVAKFATLISGPNPFADWDVSDRYSDCAHITQDAVDRHIAAAHQVLAMHQQALIDGALA